jgi:hypothetical protein
MISFSWVLSLCLPALGSGQDDRAYGIFLLLVGVAGSPAWWANVLLFPGLIFLLKEEKNHSGPIIISIALFICIYFAITFDGSTSMGPRTNVKYVGFYVWTASMAGLALLLIVRAISEGPVIDRKDGKGVGESGPTESTDLG